MTYPRREVATGVASKLLTFRRSGQASARGLIVDTSELGDVEAIKVHDLVPGCGEVVHKFLLRVRASVNF